MEKDFWQGVRDALPTALGYISIGLACGVVASPYLSPLEMALMSILVYAGAAQFAMISLIAAHSSILNMALTVCLINLRNMLMSLHTSSDFKDASLAHTIGIGSLLTDESYGVYLSEKLKTDTHYSSLDAWEQSSRLRGLDQCDGYRDSSRISPT